MTPGIAPMTLCRERLASPGARALWCGFVQSLNADQDTVLAACNMEDAPLEIIWSLTTLEGAALPGGEGRRTLAPGAFFRLEAGKKGREILEAPFRGQCAVLARREDGGPLAVPPAVTSHWTSSQGRVEVGSQALGRWNGPDAATRGRFTMFCPVVRVDARHTTAVLLFNHATDPAYGDNVELQASLRTAAGDVEGPLFRVPPFGGFFLDAAAHFGDEGRRLLAAAGGEGVLTASHAGHVLTSYFFHLDRKTGDVLAGQHTQPPASVLRRKGIWWGRLRRWVP